MKFLVNLLYVNILPKGRDLKRLYLFFKLRNKIKKTMGFQTFLFQVKVEQGLINKRKQTSGYNMRDFGTL